MAEIVLAVDDAFQHQGLGFLAAGAPGFAGSQAWDHILLGRDHGDNRRMLEIFHRAGFQVQETLEHGYVQLALSITLTEGSVSRSELLDRLFTTASLRPLFQPRP